MPRTFSRMELAGFEGPTQLSVTIIDGHPYVVAVTQIGRLASAPRVAIDTFPMLESDEEPTTNLVPA